MINLIKIIKLHFGSAAKPKNKTLVKMLDKDMDISPEDLAIYVYRVQKQIVALYGEDKYKHLLRHLSYIQRMYTQAEIYYSAIIGDNLKILHGLGTVIGARVVIGNNVSILQNVTLGGKVGHSAKPSIGDNTVIYAGAKIIGDVRIGKNCIVGANAVVLQSFPDNSVIAGVPAKLIKMKQG